MSREHTTIPWGPVIPHEVYEGYVAFCERQRDRVRRMNPDFERRHQERRASAPKPDPFADLRELDKLIGEDPKC